MAEQIIREVYFDPEDGFGSIETTFREANRRDPTITRKQMKGFLDNLAIRQRKRGSATNSDVVDWPREQLQVDLADMTGSEAPDVSKFLPHIQALAEVLAEGAKKSMDLGAAATFLRKREGFTASFKDIHGLTTKQLFSSFNGLKVTTGAKG